MTTGKNKIEFEKWYESEFKDNNLPYKQGFDICDFRCKIGVYLAYYDSLGVNISVDISERYLDNYWFVYLPGFSELFTEGLEAEYKTRNGAYKAAFEEADKLRNKEL